MRTTAPAAIVVFSCLAAGCGEELPPEPAVRRTVEGNVTRVENLHASAWGAAGELAVEATIGIAEGAEEYMLGQVRAVAATETRTYVLDTSVPVIRVYDAAGEYLGDAGRAGQGPAEYERPNGLAITPDGRLLVSDMAPLKLLVFDADGEHLENWTWTSTMRTFSTPSVLPLLGGGPAGAEAWVIDMAMHEGGDIDMGFRAIGPEGSTDTFLIEPDPEFEPRNASAPRGDGTELTITGIIDFMPRPISAMAPDGTYYGGDGREYLYKAHRPDGTELHVSRSVGGAAVAEQEAADAEARAERMIRNAFGLADWKYNGDPVPRTKATFTRLAPDADGDRLWVERPRESTRLRDCTPESLPAPEGSCWDSGIVWDVFANDGTYLGEVEPPTGSSLLWSHIQGDRIVFTELDEDGVYRVHRARLKTPAAPIS